MSDQVTKRKSVFKILITRIFVVVLIINGIFAGINIYNTVQKQKESEDKRRKEIIEQLKTTRDFLDSSLESIQRLFYFMQSNAAQLLIELGKTNDLKTIDLYEQLELIGLDSTDHDLYIIENAIIVNTTHPADLGLDFMNFGEKHIKMLLDIEKSGEFYQESFDFEKSTKRLRSFSYQVTKDKKYIVEIGSYSDKADELMEILRKQLNKIQEKNEDIISVNLWRGREDYQNSFMIEDNDLQIDSLIVNVFTEKKDILLEFEKDGREITAEFLYYSYPNSDPIVISIVTDITDRNLPIYYIILTQTIYAAIFLVFLLLLITLATGSFRRVLRDLLKKTVDIANGNIDERVGVVGNNEFTTLAEQFNRMVDRLEASYNELFQQNEEITAQRDEIEKQRNVALAQKEIIENQKDEILASINYAQKIQSAVLPNDDDMNRVMPEHFVLFKPRDIVSGDFYWMKQVRDFVFFVAADCTGHGVPGAFMSMLGISFLNELVTKSRMDSSGEILNGLRKKIKTSLHQTGAKNEQKDGMDLVLAVFDFKNRKVQYSGAYNPLIIIRDNELIEYKGDKQPISIHVVEKDFTTHDIDLQENDRVYMFSDGFADQIGGPRNRKFMVKNLKGLLVDIHEKPMLEQKQILDNTIVDWMKDESQVDDIVMYGAKID